MTETLYLIDAHSLIFQVFYAIPSMTGAKGQPTNAVYGFTGDMMRLWNKKPEYIVAVFDPKGGTFRDELYAEYKADRAPMPDDLAAQIPVIFEVLQAMNIPIVQVSGYEADDAIATIATAAEERAMNCYICTGDKDIRQLITDRTKILNLRKDKLMGREELLEEWSIRPDQIVDLLSLMGDKVDNVPGVPGIGIKTAQKLMGEYGDIETIIANVDKIKAKRVRENLKEHTTTLEMGRKLITLERNVPMTVDWVSWRLGKWKTPELLEIFRECRFRRYSEEVRAVEPTASGSDQQDSLFGSTESQEGDKEPADDWQAEYHLVDSPEKLSSFLDELRGTDRFAIDLETTGLDPHTSKIVGYAISWKAGEGHYLAVRGPGGSSLLNPEETIEELRPILENSRVQKVNQNIKFDSQVLLSAGVKIHGIVGDSMIASYLLTAGERNHGLDDLSRRYLGHGPISITDLIGKGKKQKRMDEVDPAQVAAYAGEDADIALRLCEVLEPKLKEVGLDKLYKELEIPLVEVLVDMEYTGVRVDVAFLNQLSSEFADRLSSVEKSIFDHAGHSFNIGSPKQLRQVLFTELKLPALRKTSITGEASTGQDVLEELAAAGHELPRLIIEHRQISKLKGTYVDALPGLVNPATNRVHASFNQTIAATGRLSSSDPNLQNIPIRTEQGRQIRQAFIPGHDDWLFLTADYSQIELRVLAHFSQDEELKKAFQDDRDIHDYVAAQIYGIDESEVDAAQRRNAKTVNFGVIYGLSAFGLANRLGMTNEEASQFIDAYFARYPGVLDFQTDMLKKTRENGFVETILGRRRLFENSLIREKSSYKQRNQAEREALNTVIQGSAADLIKAAMVNVYRRLNGEGSSAKLLMQIHDELVFESPREELDSLAALVDEEMTGAIEFSVPLKVDIAAGPNWLETKPV